MDTPKSMKCVFIWTLLILLTGSLLLTPGGTAFAQASNAQVNGLITDATGAALPEVKIRIVNIETNFIAEVETNSAGVYLVVQLIPGVYTITATKAGLKSVEQVNVVLRTGENRTFNFTLQMSSVREAITVTDRQSLVETSDASSANVIDNKIITQLPQLNRNTLDYMALNPSSQGDGPNYVDSGWRAGLKGSTYALAGGQSNGASTTVDGASMNEGDSNVINRAVPSPDAIGEFRVQTGVLTADSGRYSGGTITMSTLSGTNAVHGKLFEYFRNQAMNANSWYNNHHDIAKDVNHQNNFGGAVGGPVWIPKLYDGRNRTFFFLAYEGQRFKTGQMSQSTVPTAEEREGIFTNTIAHYDPDTGSPVPMQIFDPYNGSQDGNGNWVRPAFANAIIPKALWSQVGYNLLNLYPLPNHAPLFNTSNQNNYWAPVQTSFPIERLTARVDENINPSHRINVRVTRYNATYSESAPYKLGYGRTNKDLDWSGSIQYAWVMSPTSIFEARVGSSYANLRTSGGSMPDPDIDATKLGFDPMMFKNQTNIHNLPSVNNVGLYSQLGGQYLDGIPSQNYNFTAAYTKVWGRHLIKTGFEYYHTSMHEYGGDPSGVNDIFAGNGTRQFWNADNNTGYGPADFLLGSAEVHTYGQFNYSPYSRSFAGFLMDDWKVTNKLTVQVGLRIDHDGPKKVKYAKTGVVWDLQAKNVLTPNANWDWSQVQAGAPELANLGAPSWIANGVNGRSALLGTSEYPGNVLWSTNAAVWQPRLAISYALNDKTVIHASGGIIYQGLYGLGMDASGNIYYGNDTFNQQLSLDGQHWISEIGQDRGLGAFPLQSDGSHLGYVPSIKTNQDWYYTTFGQLPSPAAGTALIEDRHQGSPQEYAWGARLERQIGSSWVATAEYSGLRGIHMVQAYDSYRYTNVSPEYYSLGSHLYDNVPNPFYGQSAVFSGEPTLPLWNLLGSMPQYSSAGPGMTTWGHMMSHYFNLQLQTRNYHGLSLLASYNYRRSLTTTGAKDWRNYTPAQGNMQDPNNLDEAYGPAYYEIPQKLLMYYSYDLPIGHGRRFLGSQSSWASKVLDKVIGGWAIAGVTTYYPQGIPVEAPIVPNSNSAPNAVVRYSVNGAYKNSNFSPDCGLLVDDQFVSSSPCRYFNPAAFERTPDYSFGNLPKFYPDVHQPGGFTTDATVMKNLYFSENQSRYLNLRLEAYNFFNHSNYGEVITNPDSVAFGGLNGKNGNRLIQIGARIFF